MDAPEHLEILDPATGESTPLTEHLPGRQKEATWQATVDLTLTAPESVHGAPVGHPVPVTATVRNNGPAIAPDTKVRLDVPSGLRLDKLRSTAGRCDSRSARCDLGALAPGETAQVTAEVVGTAAGDQRLGWTTHCALRDAWDQDNTATTVVPVGPTAPPPPPPDPGVDVVLAPQPSYVGGRTEVTYTVRNQGGSPATGLTLNMALPPGVPVVGVPPGCTPTRCPLPDLPPGGVVGTRILLAPNAALNAQVSGDLASTGTDANPANNRAQSPYRVLQPRIVAVPDIGEPGFVTSVRGVDFPPGVPVRLAWTPGITAAAAPTLPGPDGRFAAPLLVLPKDQTGPRTITASGPGFSPVTTRFLVVTLSAAPPGMVGRR